MEVCTWYAIYWFSYQRSPVELNHTTVCSKTRVEPTSIYYLYCTVTRKTLILEQQVFASSAERKGKCKFAKECTCLYPYNISYATPETSR